jgi:hypothetical protein
LVNETNQLKFKIMIDFFISKYKLKIVFTIFFSTGSLISIDPGIPGGPGGPGRPDGPILP